MEQYYDTAPQRVGIIKGAMLKHAIHTECLGITGRQRSMERNMGNTIKYRRVVPWGATKADFNTQNRPAVVANQHQVQEGVTPEADTIEFVDVVVSLHQYAVLYKYTDDTADLHEDRIPAEMVKQTGERIGLLREMLKYGALKACANRFWAAKKTGRSGVVDTLAIADLRRIDRALRANHGKWITSVMDTTPDLDQKRVESGYLAFCHTDVVADLRALNTDASGTNNFTPVARYGGSRKTVHECEEGTVEKFRFVVSPELAPYKNSGGAVGSTGNLSSDDTNLDVYPIIIVARDAWADLTLRGMNSIAPRHLPANRAEKSDPLAQRGYIGAKFRQNPFIENDGWMAVLEVAVSDV